MLLNSKETEFTYKQTFFQMGDVPDEKFYYIIEGEVIIEQKNKNKIVDVCSLSDGSIFGEEILFFPDRVRPYTVKALSMKIRFLEIHVKTFHDLLRMASETIEGFIKSSGYNRVIEDRLAHYEKYKSDSIVMKQSFNVNYPSEMKDSVKNKRLRNIS